ncbi:hypothetical protein LEMLEM_LOCUS14223 [Lemmus lemmus]
MRWAWRRERFGFLCLPRTWIKTASHHTGLKWVGWPVIFNEELFKYQREAVFGGSSLESLIDRGRTRMMAASLRVKSKLLDKESQRKTRRESQ